MAAGVAEHFHPEVLVVGNEHSTFRQGEFDDFIVVRLRHSVGHCDHIVARLNQIGGNALPLDSSTRNFTAIGLSMSRSLRRFGRQREHFFLSQHRSGVVQCGLDIFALETRIVR